MTVWARADDVVVVEVDGELLAWQDTRISRLDVPATAVWQLLDGVRDEAEVVRELAARFRVPEEVVAADVAPLLERLREQGLVVVQDD